MFAILMSPTLANALPVILLVLVLSQLYRSVRGPVAHLPGPWYTKYTGLWLKIKTLTGQKSRYLHSLHQTYGGIVRMAPDEVSVADLAATKEIYKPSNNYLKTEFFKNISPQNMDTIFSAVDPHVHARFRRVLGAPMAESNIKNMHPTVKERAKVMVSQLLLEQERQGHFDFLKWTRLFAQDVVATASFGHRFNTLELGQNSQYLDDIKTQLSLGSIIFQLFGCPAWKLSYIPVWPISTMNNATKRTEDKAREMLNAYRNDQQTGAPAQSHTMLFSHILGEKGRILEFSELELVHAAQGNLIAGTDTTGHTLTYLVMALIQSPKAMAKLRAELMRLPEDPSHEDLKGCDYLSHCIEETLRLYGGIMSSLPRRVPPGGKALGGYMLPEGTMVAPIAYVLHRDEKIFPDPYSFNPDRWHNADKDLSDAMTTFGGGSRVCLGMHMARMEMRVAVFVLLRRVKSLSLAIGHDGFSEGDMEMLDFFGVQPKGDRCLLIAERSEL